MEDGGYYAIKGFAFQLDKAILLTLNTADENKTISIEQIQDINNTDFIMQVKYKESQDYSDTKIREPVIQLIEEFQKNSTKQYKLYCYFKNKIVGEEKLSIDKLNSILALVDGKSKEAIKLNERINSIDTCVKNLFLNNFRLLFAPDYDAQFGQVLKKLQLFSFVGKNNEDLAVFYYSNLVDYLKRIVISNSDPNKRVFTRKQLIDYLKNGKRLIFNSSYEEYKGKEHFFKFIKSNFVKAKKNQKSLLFFGDVKLNSSISLGKLLIDIIDRYYTKATYDIEPLTFVLPDKSINDVKIDLLNNNIIFNDGYESVWFNEYLFHRPAIKTRKTSGLKASESLDKISYKIRILSKTKFDSISNPMQFQMVYYFDSEIHEKCRLFSFQKIETLCTKQILELFTF